MAPGLPIVYSQSVEIAHPASRSPFAPPSTGTSSMTNWDCRNDRRLLRPLAILRSEPEAEDCARAIEKAAKRRISAANFLETAIIIDASRDPLPAVASTTCFTRPPWSSSPLHKHKPKWREQPIGISEKEVGTPQS